MKAVHARLREWGTPEWLLVFEGRHQWMPAGIASEALAWMELLAMKRGLRRVDPDFVAARLEEHLARARALEAAGRPLATQAGFYWAREFLARKDQARALAALTVSTEATPERPGHWYNLACVQARLGGRRQALVGPPAPERE